MIATEAQYAIAQQRIGRFEETIALLEGDDDEPWRDLQMRSIREQTAQMRRDLSTYDRLASGEAGAVVAERLADLPEALVAGRIAAGLDQSQLAARAGVATRRLRRWEKDGYSRVPLGRLERIASLIGVQIRGGVDADAPKPAEVRRSMVRAGLPREVFDRALMPTGVDDRARGDELELRLNALFGSGAAAFAASGSFQPQRLRFKLPQGAAQDRTRAYAAYVEGLCAIVAKTQGRPTVDLPKRWGEVRPLIFPTGAVSLEAAVESCWSLGIGVIGLDDRVAFHGACRRRGGRATIVLKQPLRYASRWLFDLLHEVFHLISSTGDFALLEGKETSPERLASRDEHRANRFASMVLTDGRVDALVASVSRAAGGQVPRLRSAVAAVSSDSGVPVGILANLVARSVSESNRRINWWGTARTLQEDADDPWKIVRDRFLMRADMRALSPTERAIVRQIAETRE